jgi:hypothetical protein
LNHIHSEIEAVAIAFRNPSTGDLQAALDTCPIVIELVSFPDSYGKIITQTLIPAIRNMHTEWVPSTFVDQLLWLPTDGGSYSWLRCSDIEESDRVFGKVRKKYVSFFFSPLTLIIYDLPIVCLFFQPALITGTA